MFLMKRFTMHKILSYWVQNGGERWLGLPHLWSSKKTIELIINPCSEFRWSPEGPVSQIHSPHLHAGAPGIFSGLLRSVQMLKREWGAESNGKLPHLFIPWWNEPWFLSLRWKTCLWVEFRPWFLSLQWRTCPWAEYSDDDDDDDELRICIYYLYVN